MLDLVDAFEAMRNAAVAVPFPCCDRMVSRKIHRVTTDVIASQSRQNTCMFCCLGSSQLPSRHDNLLWMKSKSILLTSILVSV